MRIYIAYMYRYMQKKNLPGWALKKHQNPKCGDTKKRGLIRLLSTAAFAAGISHFPSYIIRGLATVRLPSSAASAAVSCTNKAVNSLNYTIYGNQNIAPPVPAPETNCVYI